MEPDVLKRFEKERKAVGVVIEESLKGRPEKLYEASNHLSLAGGKMVRPMLCILSCRAVGGRPEDAYRTAAAVELIHTFTLIHDDIMDNDDLRRGRPSVHKIYGLPTAILAGDLLFSKAFEICDPKAAGVLAKASSRICEGQEMDMSFEERPSVPEKEYLEMIEKKTAVLLSAAAQAGAVVGGGSPGQADALASYGTCLGMAFQIRDDILGVVADEKKLGKPVGSDIVEGKKSLVVIKSLEDLEVGERNELSDIIRKADNTQEEVKRAVELFRKSGALEYCRMKALEYVAESKKALENLPASDARDDLMKLADYVVEREL
ncbi:MAG: polyprenyl synthetase family protein [Candidatus Altiarchaeota archaeon]|nr:polyprenyl synthetase family protein [Candidatus Altiarchaeota archaeon]